MSDKVPGYVFVINIAYQREGSGVDADLAKKTFEFFGAKVEVWSGQNTNGPTKEEIQAKMKELGSPEWQTKFEACEYVVFVFASHGFEHLNVQFFKQEQSSTARTQTEFNNIRLLLLAPLIKMSVLDKKLKWLIIQSCRGPNTYVTRKTDVEKPIYFHDYYLISCPTGEGGNSRRIAGSHSLFLKEIFTQLMENEQKGIKAVLAMTDQNIRKAPILKLEDGMPEGFQATQTVDISDNFPDSDFYLRDACFRKTSYNYCQY